MEGCISATDRAATPPAAPRGVSLTTLRVGQVGVVRETTLDPADAALLRAMGLRPNVPVRMCRVGEPCIVEVMSGGAGDCGGACACRIGLARPLAERVLIGPVGAP